jgi:hypothetical protein
MARESDSQTKSLSIQHKIEQAHRLYDICGASLRQEPSISSSLEKVQWCIENTNKTMLTLGVVAQCEHCEMEDGGSCCGAGIENKYGPVLLLMNLLLGTALPSRAQMQDSCYFLGENGCKLTVRHVLCVNYICKKIQNKLTRGELIELQSCTGEQLDKVFVLHEAIKKKIQCIRCKAKGAGHPVE